MCIISHYSWTWDMLLLCTVFTFTFLCILATGLDGLGCAMFYFARENSVILTLLDHRTSTTQSGTFKQWAHSIKNLQNVLINLLKILPGAHSSLKKDSGTARFFILTLQKCLRHPETLLHLSLISKLCLCSWSQH